MRTIMSTKWSHPRVWQLGPQLGLIHHSLNPQMPKLFCITSDIPGSTGFSVTIDNDRTVEQLKQKIKMALELSGLMANALLLYKNNALGNNLKERNEALEKKIRRVEEARKTNNDTGLDPLDAIQDVFPYRPPQRKQYTYWLPFLQASQ